MEKIKVLFVCIHNSARSQMAEAYLNKFAGDRFIASSAGIAPGRLNPVVVAAMKDDGIDISGNKTKSVEEFLDKKIDYVISVCDATSGERCPIFPGAVKRLHVEFPDPSALKGSFDEVLDGTMKIRDDIKVKVAELVRDIAASQPV